MPEIVRCFFHNIDDSKIFVITHFMELFLSVMMIFRVMVLHLLYKVIEIVNVWNVNA